MNAVLVSAPAAQSHKPSTRPNEESKSSQPFGAVLSGQIAHQANKESSKPSHTDKHVAHKEKTESKASDTQAPVPEGVTTLPADMLAQLIKQGKATTNSASESATASGEAMTGIAEQLASAQAGVRKETKGTTAPDFAVSATEVGESSTIAKQPFIDDSAQLTTRKDTAADAGIRFGAALDTAKTAMPLERPLPEISAPNTPAVTSQPAMLNLAQQTMAAAPTQLAVTTPVGRKDWGDDFGQKITWLATNNQQTAELHLNPPQLGPLDVVISVSGDQATAFFSSPHAAVRDAVEQAMPKLREMMADNGITLGNASVNDQARDSAQDAYQRSGNGRTDSISDNMATGAQQPVALATPVRRHNGLLDTFA